MVKDKSYKPINVTVSDWADYNDLAKTLTQELGFPVSVPNVIRKAITYYKDHNHGRLEV